MLKRPFQRMEDMIVPYLENYYSDVIYIRVYPNQNTLGLLLDAVDSNYLMRFAEPYSEYQKLRYLDFVEHWLAVAVFGLFLLVYLEEMFVYFAETHLPL